MTMILIYRGADDARLQEDRLSRRVLSHKLLNSSKKQGGPEMATKSDGTENQPAEKPMPMLARPQVLQDAIKKLNPPGRKSFASKAAQATPFLSGDNFDDNGFEVIK
jgi:hypothetical protein